MSDTHSHSAAFVRTETLPQLPPPVTERGAIKWMREKLFATIPNAILTLVSLYVVFSVLSGVLPWIFNGVWNASSLAECREILDGTRGACFAVLTERWPQLLFGLAYPSTEYWRPGLAFVMLFVAAAPVLFFDLPRKLLIFTALYPFIAFWLIWGGTILTPILALVGFVAGYLVYQKYVASSFALGFLGGVLAAIIVWWLGGMLIPENASDNAMLVSVASRNLGIALALGRQSSMPLIKWICVVFIEFIRGVPLITLLFVASVLLAYFFPPESSVDLFLRVVIMITMFSAAYIAEVIRGGLAALPKGQYEAGNSLGLDYAQSMRLIILPQALKISIPGIVNIAVGLFKDTTLVSVISMFDIVGMIRGPILSSSDWIGVYWELLGFAALLFFIVCYGISQYSQWLERRLATDHR